MSTLKPIFRQLREAVLDGMGNAKDRLHQVTEKFDDHLGRIIARIRAKDRFDGPDSSGGTRIPTRDQFDTYRDSLPTRGPNYGSPEARDFQVRNAGDTEYQIETPGGETVWADGLRYDPAAGGVVAESKYVDNPGASSIYEGTAPQFLVDKEMKRFQSEIERYAQAIADPNNPLTRLDLTVATPAAEAFLSGQLQRIAGEIFESSGTILNYTLKVGI